MSDAGVDGPNPAFRPEEPGTIAVPGSIFLWCPGRIRTVDTRFRRAVLYPLSYGGMLY